MGLDTVELVMEIEDEFGFQMSDHDAEVIQTCGQLCAYVLERVKPDPLGRTPCPTARAFHFLRRELMAQVPLPKRSLRPGTKLTDVLTEPYRSRWPTVAWHVGLKDFYSFGGRSDVFFPAAFTRLGDLARKIALPKPYLIPDLSGSIERQVWERVRQIVSEQIGVAVSEIHPHSHFIRDLHMG